jgi:hypothetical protein
MRIIFSIKKSLLPLGIILYYFFVQPIKSFALEYTPLEEGAFDGFEKTEGTQLSEFLSQAFQFGLALAAALAVIMIVWGGVQIMTTDSWTGKASGKEKVWNAIWGLILALVSWLILYTINPDLLKFNL